MKTLLDMVQHMRCLVMTIYSRGAVTDISTRCFAKSSTTTFITKRSRGMECTLPVRFDWYACRKAVSSKYAHRNSSTLQMKIGSGWTSSTQLSLGYSCSPLAKTGRKECTILTYKRGVCRLKIHRVTTSNCISTGQARLRLQCP